LLVGLEQLFAVLGRLLESFLHHLHELLAARRFLEIEPGEELKRQRLSGTLILERGHPLGRGHGHGNAGGLVEKGQVGPIHRTQRQPVLQFVQAERLQMFEVDFDRQKSVGRIRLPAAGCRGQQQRRTDCGHQAHSTFHDSAPLRVM
jgi:hypothetical protein